MEQLQKILQEPPPETLLRENLGQQNQTYRALQATQETVIIQETPSFFASAFDRIYFTAELRMEKEYAKINDQINQEQLLCKDTGHRIIQFHGDTLSSQQSNGDSKLFYG